jgi:hypothetical protein
MESDQAKNAEDLTSTGKNLDTKDPTAVQDTDDDSNVLPETESALLDMPQTMRRVDWRWAVAKGFLNKETNEWNENMGGQKAYLKQRNDRMIARYNWRARTFHHSQSSQHVFGMDDTQNTRIAIE